MSLLRYISVCCLGKTNTHSVFQKLVFSHGWKITDAKLFRIIEEWFEINFMNAIKGRPLESLKNFLEIISCKFYKDNTDKQKTTKKFQVPLYVEKRDKEQKLDNYEADLKQGNLENEYIDDDIKSVHREHTYYLDKMMMKQIIFKRKFK